MWLAIQVALVLALAATGVAAPWVGPMLKLEPPLIGAFTGALIGSAAAMLGALLTRLVAKSDKQSSDAERRRAIKTLIAAELVNVSGGYIGLQRTMRAAQRAIAAGESALGQVDFSNEMPRSMPFTSALGTELLVLSPSEIDVLSTLESNLSLTQRQLQEVSTGKRNFGLLTVPALSQGIAHDMDILAQAFEKLAPLRKLAVENQPPELAPVLLRRLAAQLNAGN
jgi:hypothetical protein